MKPSEVLRAARAKIETLRQVSKATALLAAVAMAPGCAAAMDVALEYLHRACGNGECMSVEVWFAGGRTHAEVLALFDRAIAAAEARGE